MNRKINKILNYTVMVAALSGAILSFINKEWHAGIWALNCLLWVVICHITENSYYDSVDALEKSTDELYHLYIENGKLKDEIKKLKKGE